MRVLITGAAGFIGSHLLDRCLEDGHTVTVIDDLSSGDRSRVPDTIALHVTDVADTAAVTEIITDTRPEVIYHLAAQISVRHSVADPYHDARANVLGTLNVVSAATTVGARVILASTGGAMYGDGVQMPTPESVLPQTQAPYGISKYCAEQYLTLHNRLYGGRHIALRLGNVYGPRQDPHGEAGVVAIFCGRIARGEAPTIFGDGKQTRDYVYISDIIDAFIGAADYSGTEAVFNIGSGKGTSVLELLEAVNAAAGASINPQFAPPRDGEWRHGALNSSLATTEMGWRATLSVVDGISRTYGSLSS
ncbi:NAD-dependent epimerase/dehydratase family protein [Nocardia sp. NBC_00508]|uniref:NAD-dependent epimerase/dehydratase family protein n=1 Tax=Nocardia sp. NBC_00508 TaxID=2975992 RepID=UPI002E8073FA|nr:NAD-dependent epimerase/dehydratase family protein [Nocardia sp. NBC_00508]WUD68676.1 NAD-dependent epimerase/dehydratase family protein [Nocardia sp. NBC_00508]